MVADELGGGGGVQVGVVGLVAHPRVHHRRWGGLRVQARVSRDAEIFTKAKILERKSTCGPVQLLDLSFVSVNKELVEVVLGGGLVVVTPAKGGCSLIDTSVNVFRNGQTAWNK